MSTPAIEKPAVTPVPSLSPVPIVSKPKTTVKPATAPILTVNSSQSDVIAMIVKWSNFYGSNTAQLLRIGKCESSYNPLSVNHNYTAGGGHPSGVFQFLPETFLRYEAKAGLSGLNIFNAEDNVRVAAYAFSVGGSVEWQCK